MTNGIQVGGLNLGSVQQKLVQNAFGFDDQTWGQVTSDDLITQDEFINQSKFALDSYFNEDNLNYWYNHLLIQLTLPEDSTQSLASKVNQLNAGPRMDYEFKAMAAFGAFLVVSESERSPHSLAHIFDLPSVTLHSPSYGVTNPPARFNMLTLSGAVFIPGANSATVLRNLMDYPQIVETFGEQVNGNELTITRTFAAACDDGSPASISNQSQRINGAILSYSPYTRNDIFSVVTTNLHQLNPMLPFLRRIEVQPDQHWLSNTRNTFADSSGGIEKNDWLPNGNFVGSRCEFATGHENRSLENRQDYIDNSPPAVPFEQFSNTITIQTLLGVFVFVLQSGRSYLPAGSERNILSSITGDLSEKAFVTILMRSNTALYCATTSAGNDSQARNCYSQHDPSERAVTNTMNSLRDDD